MARIVRPPSRRAQKRNPPAPQLHILRAGTTLVRLYNPARFGVGPLTFRRFGPLLRFDHHPGEGSGMKRLPAEDVGRGVLYAAPSLACCVAEVFGDLGAIVPGECRVALIEVTRDLRLLDLVDEAMAAGTIAALAATEHHRKAQEWSRRFYEDEVYGRLDGIYYRAAHTGEEAFAFYERAEDGLSCPEANTVRLDDGALRAELLAIAARQRLVLEAGAL